MWPYTQRDHDEAAGGFFAAALALSCALLLALALGLDSCAR